MRSADLYVLIGAAYRFADNSLGMIKDGDKNAIVGPIAATLLLAAISNEEIRKIISKE